MRGVCCCRWWCGGGCGADSDWGRRGGVIEGGMGVAVVFAVVVVLT